MRQPLSRSIDDRVYTHFKAQDRHDEPTKNKSVTPDTSSSSSDSVIVPGCKPAPKFFENDVGGTNRHSNEKDLSFAIVSEQHK